MQIESRCEQDYLLSYQTKTLRQNWTGETKKGYIILVKGTLQQGDTAIINICALNVRLPNFIKQTLLDIKGVIGLI